MQKKSFVIIGLLMLIMLAAFASAATVLTPTVCCEKTNYSAYCMNTDESKCDADYRSSPTSCDSTSFCALGCCYDSAEGLCSLNTPQIVCENSNGTWNPDKNCDIPQCEAGCCVLVNQAAFVPLVRCKKLSAFYGLKTDFRKGISSEIECIAVTQAQDRGACVYEADFARTCKFTTRKECEDFKFTVNGTVTNDTVIFHKDYLCSAEELGTNCGQTTQTTCVDGKDGVYFVDSCGNTANIYDAARQGDPNYWRKVIPIEQSCSIGANNANAARCGNCDYYGGTMCKEKKKAGVSPVYGNYACRGLNCANGKKHGESWCIRDDNAPFGSAAVGSRYYTQRCIMGEVTTEGCDVYRHTVCINATIPIAGGSFSQANCMVNKWEYCTTLDNEEDCTNLDKGDCIWTSNRCIPKYPPGLKFWEEGDAVQRCALANAKCTVTLEKTGTAYVSGGDFEATSGDECIGDVWGQDQNTFCRAMGDCGANVNIANVIINKGYKWTDLDEDKGKLKVSSLSDSILNNIKNAVRANANLI